MLLAELSIGAWICIAVAIIFLGPPLLYFSFILLVLFVMFILAATGLID